MNIEYRSMKESDIAQMDAGFIAQGYGAAQRLYIRRGYLPDGSGIWYQDKHLAAGESCKNDDDLVLYMSKALRK